MQCALHIYYLCSIKQHQLVLRDSRTAMTRAGAYCNVQKTYRYLHTYSELRCYYTYKDSQSYVICNLILYNLLSVIVVAYWQQSIIFILFLAFLFQLSALVFHLNLNSAKFILLRLDSFRKKGNKSLDSRVKIKKGR